jgi:hypothetical protein
MKQTHKLTGVKTKMGNTNTATPRRPLNDPSLEMNEEDMIYMFNIALKEHSTGRNIVGNLDLKNPKLVREWIANHKKNKRNGT